MISGFFKCILIFCSVCPLFHKGVKKAEILKGKRNCVCSSTTATKSATSFLVPRDTSERVALVPIFYFTKNQPPVFLFRLLSKKSRRPCTAGSQALMTLRLAANFWRVRLRDRSSFLSPSVITEYPFGTDGYSKEYLQAQSCSEFTGSLSTRQGCNKSLRMLQTACATDRISPYQFSAYASPLPLQTKHPCLNAILSN